MSTAARALARRRWAKRKEDKVCPFCEQPFKGDSRQVYCTPAHQNAAAAKRFRERRRPTPGTGDE
jgi:hypothetical protein